jgi:UDP-N-acetyl-D-mannosaminuronic acid dehydrogenase
MEYRVCVVGVGYVGLTFALAVSRKGIPVVGIERDRDLINSLKSCQTNVLDTGILEALQESITSGRLVLLNSQEDLELARNCNVYVITVGTPLSDGKPNLTMIQAAIDQILPLLSDGNLLVVRSTTMIGTCEELILPRIQATGMRVNVAMCPERTVEGYALQEFDSLPQIISGFDEKSLLAAKEFFSSVGVLTVPVSSLKAAELAKLANNTYRDLMFAYANEIAMVAMNYGISASEIIRASNFEYERCNISIPGPVGGPCLEKDPWILYASGLSVGIELKITKNARETNESFPLDFLSRTVQDFATKPSRVALLGLSFKGYPQTRDTRGTVAAKTFQFLKSSFPSAKISGFEPAGVDSLKLFPGIELSHDFRSCLDGSQLVVINNLFPDNQSEIEDAIREKCEKGALVIDFWNQVIDSRLGPEKILRTWGETRV